MEVSYKRNFNESYMIVEGEAFANGYEEQMLRRNQIQSLLKFYAMETNGKLQFWYEITGKESLRDYLEQGTLNIKILDEIITYLALAYEEINSYLLLQEHILLKPDTVYLDRSNANARIQLCYCPMNNKTFSVQFREIIEYILTIVDHKDEQLTDICYLMYEKSMLEDYNISNIAECIEYQETAQSKMEEPLSEEPEIYVEQIDLTDKSQSEFDKEGPEEILDKLLQGLEDIYGKIKDIIKKKIGVKINCNKKINQNYTDVVVEPMPKEFLPTQLLKKESEICMGKLQYLGELKEDDYLINKEKFHIGSREENNDANLQSEAVSRHHAKITRKGNDFYVEDLNSTNGTYVNGELLDYRKQLRLSANDKIMFANVPYLFI